MTIAQMRDEVMKLYSGEAWKRRVFSMSDAQILAIYKRQTKK